MRDVDSNQLTTSSLPEEVWRYLLTNYCDCSDLENFWYAASSNKQQTEFFWGLLNKVIGLRIKYSAGNSDLRKIADSSLQDPNPTNWDSLFRQRLNVLTYAEQLQGVLWCGYIEFKDALLPDWNARTVKVVLRSDEQNWSWNHAVGWNQTFSHTIKLVSQMYNFVPVRPRGQIFGVTREDQAVIQGVSHQLQSRNQVMTLRFCNSSGFILRIVSPTQAHQRLARFGGSTISSLETSAEALLCSWECPSNWEDDRDAVHVAQKLEAINVMVQANNEMTGFKQ